MTRIRQILLLALSFVSCTEIRQELQIVGSDGLVIGNADSHPAVASILLGPAGELSSDKDDDRIAQVNVYIFRDSLLMTHLKFAYATRRRLVMEMGAPGIHDIFVCANGECPETGERDFIKQEVGLGDAVRESGLYSMKTASTQQLLERGKRNDVRMELEQTCTKIKIGRIECQWKCCTPESFIIERIYVQNVPARCRIWKQSIPLRTGDIPGNSFVNSWTNEDCDVGPDGTTLSFTPSKAMDMKESGSCFSPRCTFFAFGSGIATKPIRLVIKGRIRVAGKEKTEYWPYAILPCKSGTCYNFTNITICGEGCLRPDGDIRTTAAEITFELEDWNETTHFDYEI